MVTTPSEGVYAKRGELVMANPTGAPAVTSMLISNACSAVALVPMTFNCSSFHVFPVDTHEIVCAPKVGLESVIPESVASPAPCVSPVNVPTNVNVALEHENVRHTLYADVAESNLSASPSALPLTSPT